MTQTIPLPQTEDLHGSQVGSWQGLKTTNKIWDMYTNPFRGLQLLMEKRLLPQFMNLGFNDSEDSLNQF